MKGSLARVLSSPRRRRRLGWSAAFLAVAGAVAFAISQLTLNTHVDSKEVFRPGKPVEVGNQKTVLLSQADRRRITVTLERFVRDGVAAQNQVGAYDLVTPEYRGGTTRAQWQKGNSPIYVYPAKLGDIAGQWRVDYSYRREVGVALMLGSKYPRKVGQVIIHADLLERRGRWLVDGFAPVATFTPIGVGRQHETGPADYAGAASGVDTRADKAPLSALWIAIPAGLLALVLLVPLGFVVVSRVRERRLARAYEDAQPKTLPPLPVRRN